MAENNNTSDPGSTATPATPVELTAEQKLDVKDTAQAATLAAGQAAGQAAAQAGAQAAAKLDPKLAPLQKRKTLSIIIRDRIVLFAAYMPFLKNGGLFIPTKKSFAMTEACNLAVTLLNEEEKYITFGRVVWITPAGSPGNKAGGIGIEFAEDKQGERLRRRIEEILGPLLQSTNGTHTM